MAPSILVLGVPASSSLVPEHQKQIVEKGVDRMNADMDASPYDSEFLEFTPDVSFDVLSAKLKEKQWDVVVVGSECFNLSCEH